MTRWSALPVRARLEVTVYGLVALAGLVGTQVVLVDVLRDADGDVLGSVWDGITASPTAVFMGVDLFVVFLAAMVFMVVEGRRIGLRWWPVYPLLSCAIAVSFGFPLFLAARRLALVSPRPQH